MTRKRVIGPVLSVDPKLRWSMSRTEKPCTGAEFETVYKVLYLLVTSFCKQNRLDQFTIYVEGNFYYERTQCVFVHKAKALDSSLIHAVQQLLRARFKNWRVVLAVKERRGNPVIYGTKLVWNGRVYCCPAALAAAICCSPSN